MPLVASKMAPVKGMGVEQAPLLEEAVGWVHLSPAPQLQLQMGQARGEGAEGVVQGAARAAHKAATLRSCLCCLTRGS